MKVRFRQAYLTSAGFYNAGEGAEFDALTATDLVTRGIATVEEPMPIPAPVSASGKTVSTPPAHKQIVSPKGKKGAAI